MINNYIMESETDVLYDPARYTGIDQVVVDNDNDTIGLSGSFISTVNNKLDASTYNTYTAAHASDDVTPYTAGSNINITNHVVSGKDWSSDISNAITGKLDTSTYNTFVASTNSWDKTPYTAGANINITNHVVSGKDWNSEIGAKLDTSTYNTYTAAHAGDDVTPYTNGTGISITNHQISCTGDITPYSAGSNINITNHVVSGKDWSSDISNAVATKLDTTATNSWDVTNYSAGVDLKLNSHVFSIDTDSTITTGTQNFVANHGNTVSGDYNSIFGNSNNVNGYSTLVGGKSNSITGADGCFIYGEACTANISKGYGNIILGDHNKMQHSGGSNAYGNMIAGKYNELHSNSTNAATVVLGGWNKAYINDLTQTCSIVGQSNIISGGSVPTNQCCAFGNQNTINGTRRGFLFGDGLLLSSGTDDYRMKLGYGVTNHGYSHPTYIQIDANVGKVSTVVDGVVNEIQNKLTDITDVQVVNALPASPVANVLYLVKE